MILEPLKSEVLCSIMRKLTPCCRNEVQLLSSQFLADDFSFGDNFKEKRELNLWMKTLFLRSAISSMLLSSAMEGKFQNFHVDVSCLMYLKGCSLNNLGIIT